MGQNPLTDAELVILSLICEEPRHGYEIEGQINLRNMRAWTDLATSSIYYLLGKLESKGLIEQVPEAAADPSNRPRKVYQLTEKGHLSWKEATLRALSHPRITYTNFLMGLHNLWNIPPDEALQAVKNYREWLANDLHRQRDELADLGLSFFPLDVLFEYGFVIGDAELSFLADLITRLEKLTQEGISEDGSQTKEWKEEDSNHE
jgi:DNA-binding PadR family transcriptional regulator